MAEAFIEEGFLSYDDLTFMEPAQLGELAGITEEQAEDLIAFAEEAAERVGEEAEAAKAEAAENPEAQEGRAGAGTNQRPASAAAHLFKEQAESPNEPKPTMESIFGPDTQA